MALKNETRILSGIEFKSTQLPALRGFALFTKLGKILAPALTRMASMNLSMDMDVSRLAPVLGELFASLDPSESGALAKEILISTSAVLDGRIEELGNTGAIDRVFEGNVKLLLQVMLFALQVNFADFMPAASASSNESASGNQAAAKESS